MNVEEAIRTRRSIRAYEDKPVEDDKLNAVLEAARLAPSACNYQDWKFVVVRDAALRKKMVEACNGQEFVGQAGAVIAACSTNPARVMSCGVHSGIVDLAIAVDHMTLRACELGLGTCWIGAFDQQKVKDLLQIPADVTVVAVLPLGYPAEHTGPRPRKPLGEIVCHEKWA